MNLEELKKKTPAELIAHAEKLEIENPSTLRKQEILFAILKKLAQKNEQITGGGVLEVLQDGFGFLRAIESNYLPGPDDIYVSPSQIRKFGLRTGDSVEGEIRAPKDQERYFALLKVDKINFDNPEKAKNKIAFDNLTPLYPDKQLKMEIEKTKIPKGSLVAGVLRSANLDEERWTNPECFDLHRREGNHAAFALGDHRCLGEWLGRQVVRIGAQLLFERLPNLRIVEKESIILHGFEFRGPTSLNCCWEVL